MKNAIKCLLPFIVCLIGIFVLLQDIILKSSRNMLIAGLACFIALGLRIIPEIWHHGTPNEEFLHKRRTILNTYGFILTKLENVPNIKDYTYYKYDTFEKIFNKAMDSRTNIYYVYDEKTCDFLLIEQNNIYIYSLKENQDLFSRVDKYYVEVQRA